MEIDTGTKEMTEAEKKDRDAAVQNIVKGGDANTTTTTNVTYVGGNGNNTDLTNDAVGTSRA